MNKYKLNLVRQFLKRNFHNTISINNQLPVVAACHSMKVMVKKGESYWWCRCGLSKNQPFCDGSHYPNDQNIEPLEYVAKRDGLVSFCACKHTKKPPICDGAHKKLPGYVPPQKKKS